MGVTLLVLPNTARVCFLDLQWTLWLPASRGDSKVDSCVCFSFPEQVTLFAYSDLLLFTKEDEPGRCDVLRNPLYLQSVKLQEGKKGLDTPGAA